MSDKIIETELLEQIDAYCELHGITPTDFGRDALNDSALVTTLKQGRELRSRTRRRITDFMSTPRAHAAE